MGCQAPFLTELPAQQSVTGRPGSQRRQPGVRLSSESEPELQGRRGPSASGRDPPRAAGRRPRAHGAPSARPSRDPGPAARGQCLFADRWFSAEPPVSLAGPGGSPRDAPRSPSRSVKDMARGRGRAPRKRLHSSPLKAEGGNPWLRERAGNQTLLRGRSREGGEGVGVWRARDFGPPVLPSVQDHGAAAWRAGLHPGDPTSAASPPPFPSGHRGRGAL